jgi:hypothetical protein
MCSCSADQCVLVQLRDRINGERVANLQASFESQVAEIRRNTAAQRERVESDFVSGLSKALAGHLQLPGGSHQASQLSKSMTALAAALHVRARGASINGEDPNDQLHGARDVNHAAAKVLQVLLEVTDFKSSADVAQPRRAICTALATGGSPPREDNAGVDMHDGARVGTNWGLLGVRQVQQCTGRACLWLPMTTFTFAFADWSSSSISRILSCVLLLSSSSFLVALSHS